MNTFASPETTTEVAIVGAGMSGSAAAHDLLRRGLDNLVVLEADGQPGGRVRNMSLAGVSVDAGAQFVGPTQTALRELLAAFDLPLVPTYAEGRVISPISADKDNAAIEQFADALADIGSSMDLTAPWAHSEATRLDSMSVTEWTRSIGVTDRKVVDYISSRVAGAISGPAEEVSALWYAYFVASAGGWHDQTGSTLEWRVAGGTQQIPLRVGDLLGDRLRVNSPVVRIEQNAHHVRLTTVGGAEIIANQVILACSPREIARIRFEPELPSERVALNTRWHMTAGMKFAIAFDTPFWRELGFNGCIMPEPSSPVGAIFDNTPVDGSGPGILIGFAGPRHLDNRLPAEPHDRARVIEAHVHDAFGVSEPNAIDYAEQLWRDEPWVSGCMSPIRPGDILDTWHRIRSSEGRVHFAGTEASEIFNGYMEGAVRAGYRAATEVSDALTTDDSLAATSTRHD